MTVWKPGLWGQTSISVLPADPAPTTSKLARTAGIVAAQPVEEAQQFAQQHVRLARTDCDFGAAQLYFQPAWRLRCTRVCLGCFQTPCGYEWIGDITPIRVYRRRSSHERRVRTHEQTYTHTNARPRDTNSTYTRVFSFENSTRSFGVHDVLRVATLLPRIWHPSRSPGAPHPDWREAAGSPTAPRAAGGQQYAVILVRNKGLSQLDEHNMW